MPYLIYSQVYIHIYIYIYIYISQNIDVLALTETWLCCGDNAGLNELLPPGYNIRHVDRERRDGGVALIYKKKTFHLET